MAEFTKFRTSLNGFNRSDVAEYIESICSQHGSELRTAREEIEALTRQLAQAEQELQAKTEQAQQLKTELEQTQTALDATQEALEEALNELTQPAEPEEEAPQEDAPDYASLELEAYRRAEAMERTSAERAARLQQQLDELLDQVSGRYEQTGQEIQVLSEDIRINLKRLEETLSDLDAIFEDTTNSFQSMDPAEPFAVIAE